MKLIEGKLTRLGESTVNAKNEYVKYSLIQIGEQTITGVLVDRKLNNFLHDGIATEQPTKLWMLNGQKVIMGVQVGTDTRYYGTVNPFFYFAAVLFIAFTILAFSMHPVAGFAMVALTWWLYIRKVMDYRQVAAVGGTKV